MKAGLFKSILLLAAGTLTLGASAQDRSVPKGGNWIAMVTENDGGHILGNPNAAVKLIEFMSYTCSHCATFAREGDGALKLFYVPTGKISFEIRHLIRDPVDLAAALLTHCGEPKKFTLNHEAFTSRYPQWIAKAQNATQAQQSRWQFGTLSARLQAIASDLDFYEIMEARGYGRVETDKCLSDEAKARSLAETSRADIEKYGLQGTPSFVLDGKLLDNTHAWEALRPQLDEAL